MKKYILPILLFVSGFSFGQSLIGSVNTGAVSGSNLAYTVGEIFVTPTTNANEANSGLMGALSRIEFLVNGIESHISSPDVRVYPNPTTSAVSFTTNAETPFTQVFIYNHSGQLVLQSGVSAPSVDVSQLTNGIYTILTDNKSIPSFKLVKQ